MSRQHGGAGLGLAITKQFVEAHNGILTVSSEYGKGSTFTVSLPLPEYSRSNARMLAGTIPELAIDKENTLLLIDSDPHTASLLTRYLADFTLIQVEEYAI